VLNLTELPLANLLQIYPAGGTAAAGTSADIFSPELAGSVVSARQVDEYEVENDPASSDLILTTTAQALSAATPVGSRLTTSAGKLALLTASATQDEFGIVKGQIAPVAGGPFRLLVEVSH
jgi:hypothetical protein